MVRISGYFALTFSRVGTYSVSRKRPLPRTNSSTCMIGVPCGARLLQGHWMLPRRLILSKLTPVKVGVRRAISSMMSDGWA